MEYWDRRYKLLKEIKRYGNKKPLSALSRSIISPGASLNKVINSLEEMDIIIRIKDNEMVRTQLTEKGEKLLRILEELNEIIGIKNG